MIGQTLAGRYHIIRHLGEGSFGQTYLAQDKQLPDNNQCVLKHLKPQASDPLTLQTARRLFETEAQVLNRLGNHDQIPRLLAHFEENQDFYLVQDFIEGESLSQILTPGKRLSETQVINLLQEILEILEFVHNKGVIHRDIKPSSLIRRRHDGKLVLIDFGAVKQIRTQAVNTQGQANFTIAIGTEGYMPSEQARGKPRLTSDIYAVGMIAIQGLTGIPPRELQEDSQGEVIWRDRLRIDNRLAKVLDTMVRSHFTQRYQNASEALQAVKALKSRNNLAWLSILRRVDVISILGLLIAIITLIATPETRQEIGQFFEFFSPELYEDSVYGIKIKYPRDWESKEPENPFGIDLVKFSPQARVSDSVHQPELIIGVEKFTEPMSLDQYTNLHIDRISQLYKSKFRLLESDPTILAQKRAHKVIYTTNDDENLKLNSMSVWTVIDNKQAYVLTYIAEESKYAEFLKPVEEVMIKSFDVR